MGRELTPRIYSQLRRVDRRCREKFLQFARCFYDNIGQPSVDLLDLRLGGTELDSLSARNLWRKKISLEQIFTSWCLIAKITPLYGTSVILLDNNMIDKTVKQICLGCTFILTTHVTYYSDSHCTGVVVVVYLDLTS